MKVNKIFSKKSEKTKKDYLCGVPSAPNTLVDKKNPPSPRLRWTKGEMAERSNAAVLKTVEL